MKFLVPVTAVFLFVLMVLACEEPNINTSALDPGIRAVFIDVDSINAMDAEIEVIDDEISSIDDRLDEIDSLIDAGDNTDYSTEIESLDNRREELTEEKSALSEQIDNISQGYIRIEEITALEAVKDLVYDEPQSVYRLPLNGRTQETELFILYNGTINSVRFKYTTDTLLDNYTVKIMAQNLELVDFDYDSAWFQCRHNECNSDYASVIFYM